MIIAIDGPAGAGKSTIAKRVAARLGYLYIDTGAMYRAVTVKALEQGIPASDERRIVETARSANIDLIPRPDGSLSVMLDSRDVSAQIREPSVTRHVSDVAKIKGVRLIMVDLQRKLGRRRNSVIDGRDIGTVVFPDASTKIYLDADFNERVRRRYQELREAGKNVTERDVADDVRNRDTIDSTREHSPLRKARDAILVDTTNLNIDQVVEKVLGLLPQP